MAYIPQPQFDMNFGIPNGRKGMPPNWGAGIGDLIGAGLGIFGMGNYKNPAEGASPYLDQINQQLPGYFQPWMDAGKQALPQLQGQYGQMVNDPGSIMNRVGAGFQQSPGFKFQVDQATGAANRAASAGGMLGSPAEQESLARTVNGLANQDYYNYLNHGLGLYNSGVQGLGDISHMGYGASANLGEDLSNALMSQAQLAYAGQANQNQSQGSALGGISGLISGALSAFNL